jgi:hypothetical protein
MDFLFEISVEKNLAELFITMHTWPFNGLPCQNHTVILQNPLQCHGDAGHAKLNTLGPMPYVAFLKSAQNLALNCSHVHDVTPLVGHN